MNGPNFPLAITLAAGVLVVTAVLYTQARAGTLTLRSGTLLTGGIIVASIIAIVAASSTGLAHLIIAPPLLIGGGIWILYWDRTQNPRRNDGEARRFGWMTIATGIGTAVVTYLSMRG